MAGILYPRLIQNLGTVVETMQCLSHTGSRQCAVKLPAQTLSPYLQMMPLLRRHPNMHILNLKGIPSGASLLRQSLPSLTRYDFLSLLAAMSPYHSASNSSQHLHQQVGCHYRLSQLVLGDTSEISNADLGELNQLLPSLRQLTFHQANFVCVSLRAM